MASTTAHFALVDFPPQRDCKSETAGKHANRLCPRLMANAITRFALVI